MPRSNARIMVVATVITALAGCGDTPPDPRGVEWDETLLSVSASGEADVAPDVATFQAGISNWASTAKAASAGTQEDIGRIVSALTALGIARKDIQTRLVRVGQVEWGSHRGQFESSNVVTVTIRDVQKAGEALTAVTEIGANVVSGPDLRLSDPEKAANSAYAAAFKAARARADAYSEAAGMEVTRVLRIRDAGGMQGDRYLGGAANFEPAMQVAYAAAEEADYSIMPGQTNSSVAVQVDFALAPK